MRIDLHTHTNRYSHCSILDPYKLIERAQQEGLDGIVLTEHNRLWTRDEIQELYVGIASPDFLILRGQEADVMGLHVLVYGYFKQFPYDITIEKLKEEVHCDGGAIVIAHPFRWGYSTFDGSTEAEMREFLNNFDAIEAFNSNCRDDEIIRGRDLAKRLGMRIVGGSDAHSSKMVGTFCTRFSEKITTELDLAQALRKGNYRPDSCILNNPLLGSFRDIEHETPG